MTWLMQQPWYVQLFVLGGLLGGWWHFCDCIFEPIQRWARQPPKGKVR